MSDSHDLIQEIISGKRPDADLVRPSAIMPFVIESDGRRERGYDIYSLLLKERIVFLGTPIDAMVANVIIAQFLYLAREDDDKDIMMYINCPGGNVTAGLAILDTMALIRPDVQTLCMGLAASMGTIMLTSGTKGKRFALPNSTIHLHQVLGGAQGQARDIEIQARETLRLQKVLRNIIQTTTGQPMEKIEHDTDRDFWLDPPAAKEYGLIDEILERPSQTEVLASSNGKAS
jgi:ATP-dependent Clp protease, protease subunit